MAQHPALTRSQAAGDHLLLTPESHVTAPLPGWHESQGVIMVSPQNGARFTQTLALMAAGATSGAPADAVQRFAYVLEGKVRFTAADATRESGPGGYAYFPAGLDTQGIDALEASQLLLFEKVFTPGPDGVADPTPVLSDAKDVEKVPFLGDEAALLQTLLPDEAGWDMAVNCFTFAPGGHLPMVELHVMEHGLLFLDGAGVYRLGDSWYPVGAGDAIWMAPYLPQWFCAIGKSPTRYIYYKDMNRDPLLPEDL